MTKYIPRPLNGVVAVLICAVMAMSGCAGPGSGAHPSTNPSTEAAVVVATAGDLGNGWLPERNLELRYAENFDVDFYQDGVALVKTSDEARFLVVPEGVAAPEGIAADITVLQQPLKDIYLGSTVVMCLFLALDSLDSLKYVSAKEEQWYLKEAKEAVAAGQLVYSGEYKAPDYELLVSAKPSVAIQSTMINQVPEVKEKLISLGIPVLADQSSYEPHPLGRTEWIQLYGVLMDKPELAQQVMDEQIAQFEAVSGQPSTGKTVTMFYMSSTGAVLTRHAGDYLPKMITQAGGEFIRFDEDESETGPLTLEMEQFFAKAKEADYLIYSSTIGAELQSLDELVALNPLLAEFESVKSGNVWKTTKEFQQDMTGLGTMMVDMHAVFDGTAKADELRYLRPLT